MYNILISSKTLTYIYDEYQSPNPDIRIQTVTWKNNTTSITKVYSVNHKSLQVKFVKPEFWGNLREEDKYDIEYYYSISELTLKIVEDLINSGQFVYIDSYSDLFYYSSLKPIPFIKTYNYIGTILSNEWSNLPDLLKYLKQHPWVYNKDTLSITPIPYYNCTEKGFETINVDLLPSLDGYSKIVNKSKELKNPFILNPFSISSVLITEYDPMNLTQFLKSL